ncbi:unnamed protein product, partial [marine sediment metagenome]
GGTSILFSFEAMDYTVPTGAKVVDVTTGEAVAVEGEKLSTAARHTYEIRV